MPRFPLKEPLVTAQRHISNSPPRPSSNSSHQRNIYPSKVLAALDAELDRMKLHEMSATSSRGVTSNTMKMALSESGADGMAGRHNEIAGSEIPLHPFFLKHSNVSSKNLRPSKNTALASASTSVQTAMGQRLTLQDKPSIEPSKDSPRYPLYSYRSTIPVPTRFYVRDETQANELVGMLKGPLGFDLEWRVFFSRRMVERKTAILQLCDDQTILIIQLTAMKHFPAKVKDVVESQDIIKMGVNILNDGRKLWRDYGIEPAGLLELSHLARLADPVQVTSKRMISLQRIVEMYTGQSLSKGSVRTSNWEAPLNEEQLDYAANDAHSALKVYNGLRKLARESGLVLKPTIIPATLSTPAMGITFIAESSKTHGDISQHTAPDNIKLSRELPLKHGLNPENISKPYNTEISVGQSLRPRSGAVHITSPEELEASIPNATNTVRPVGRQRLRAYKLWHEEQLPLPEICSALRSPECPLAKSTVITYVVDALKADTSLPFSRTRLKELAMLEHGSWKRHAWWIISLDKINRGTVTR